MSLIDAAVVLDDIANGRPPKRALLLSGSIALDNTLVWATQDFLEAARCLAILTKGGTLTLDDEGRAKAARLAGSIRAASSKAGRAKKSYHAGFPGKINRKVGCVIGFANDKTCPDARDTAEARVWRGDFAQVAAARSSRKRTFNKAIHAVMSLNDHAWQSGIAAGIVNDKFCPYSAGTAEAWSWASGWFTGESRRLQEAFLP